MLTSPKTSILSELTNSKPIPTRTLAFYRRRFQNIFYRLLRKAFVQQGLTQKELAERTGHRAESINRWLSSPSNLTLDTICDLLLGMLVDLEEPSFTPIAKLVANAEMGVETASSKPHKDAASERIARPPVIDDRLRFGDSVRQGGASEQQEQAA